MGESGAILITLIAYKVVLVAIGFFAQRRTRDGTDFFLGGRKLGPIVAAVSASASSSSGWTLLGVSAAAYKWGLGALWLFPACVGGFVFNWLVLAPALNRHSHASGAVTVTEVLAGPMGRPRRSAIVLACTLIVLVSLGAYVAFQFQAASKAFTWFFDLDVESAILIGAGIVVFYTMLGGFWAVSITDTLQGLLMAGTAVLLPVAALLEVGGPGALAAGIGDVSVDGYQSLFRNMEPIIAIGFVLGLLGIGVGYPGQPHVVNRFMALKDDAAALKRARAIALAWAVLVYAGMLLLGLCGRIMVENARDAEQVFFIVTQRVFSPVIAGIMVAAVLSAIMSTADSMLLVAASAVTNDLGFGGTTRRSLLFRSRMVILVLAAGALVPAIFGSQEIFSNVLFAWSAMGAAFGPALIVTALKGAVAPRTTLAAIITGFLVSVGAYELRTSGAIDADFGQAVERMGAFLCSLLVVLLYRGPSHER